MRSPRPRIFINAAPGSSDPAGMPVVDVAASSSDSAGLPVVDVGFGSPEDFQKAVNLKGAIALVHSKVMKSWEDLFEEYLKQLELLAAAKKGGAAAVAFISTREQDLLYRHVGSFNDRINHFTQVLLAREDGERIARLIAAGKQVKLHYSIPNRVGGPVVR